MSWPQSLNLLNPKFCKSAYTDSEIESLLATLQTNPVIKFLRLDKFIVTISDEKLNEKLTKMQTLLEVNPFPSSPNIANKCLEDVVKILRQGTKTQLQRHNSSAIICCVAKILFFSGFGINFIIVVKKKKLKFHNFHFIWMFFF